MSRKTRISAFAAAAFAVTITGTALISSTALAHHSTAMFEWGTSNELNDVTVERWEWTNPHTFLYVRDAQGRRWAFEGMSPNHLTRAGWSKRSLNPGDRIDLTYYKLRDGRRGGFNVTVKRPNGTTLNQFGGL